MTATAETADRSPRPLVASRARPAFTLVELLVVILIVGIVVAIVLPVLSGVRTTARATTTKALMTKVTQASAQFQNDNSRMPGYFSVRDVGRTVNGSTNGLSMAENIMFELGGGIVAPGGGPAPATSPNAIKVGPDVTGTIWAWFDPNIQGVQSTSNKAYFIPDAKNYVAQTNDSGGIVQQFGRPGHTDSEGRPQVPDLVDDFGSPLCIWSADDTAVGPVRKQDEFVLEDSGATGEKPARFYWATNAAFLKSTFLGKKGADQTDKAGGAFSLIGGDPVSMADRLKSLAGVLGNPNFPYRDPAITGGGWTIPSAPRAGMIVHSAGPDGYYFGSKDRGAKQFPASGGSIVIDYMRSFLTPGGTAFVDKDGNPTINDVTSTFDDIVATGGN